MSPSRTGFCTQLYAVLGLQDAGFCHRIVLVDREPAPGKGYRHVHLDSIGEPTRYLRRRFLLRDLRAAFRFALAADFLTPFPFVCFAGSGVLSSAASGSPNQAMR